MDFDELVGEVRDRQPRAMEPRERWIVGALALGVVLACGLLSVVLPARHGYEALTVVALVILFAIAARVEFEIGPVRCVATQLVFVPMLFLTPLPLLPLLVGLGYLLNEIPLMARGKTHPDRWLYCVNDGWFAVGAVLVFGLAAPGAPDTGDIWVYALVLVGASVTMLAQVVTLDWTIHGVAPRATLESFLWVSSIDFALSPIAFITAAIAYEHQAAVLAVVPLLWLLHTFSKERAERYAAALELHQAYRGTVMVLADVVEADDNYTADHCRSVVDLAVSTAEVMGLGHREIQELETAALMHDVGKIAIPKEILNKPAKLTDEEFELMKSHTIEGQALLDRVGGRLARVGEIVRSCHERWDGRGYPDGLRGEEIPLAARIVFCCDAYSAMTTDRPYRAATTPEAAMAELRANAGTQFEPRVVDAVCEVVAADVAPAEQPYADAVRAVLASSSGLGTTVNVA